MAYASHFSHLSVRSHLSFITPEHICTLAAKPLIRAVPDVIGGCIPKAMWHSHSVRTRPSPISALALQPPVAGGPDEALHTLSPYASATPNTAIIDALQQPALDNLDEQQIHGNGEYQKEE